MKSIFFSFLFIQTFLSTAVYAGQCASVFSVHSGSNKNLELVNSLKRIRNYGYFESVILIDSLHGKMNLLVFDSPKDGVIEGRASLKDHVLELRQFASEIRFVLDKSTENHVITSLLMKEPTVTRSENLLNAKFNNEISILDNLKNSETIEISFQYEIFQSMISWLSKSKSRLVVTILPLEQRDSIVEMIEKVPHFQILSLDSTIDKINPVTN